MSEVVNSTIRVNHFSCHNITKEVHDGQFLKERGCDLKKYDDLQLLVEKFIVHNMSASHKHGIPKLKENNAHVIRNQGVV